MFNDDILSIEVEKLVDFLFEIVNLFSGFIVSLYCFMFVVFIVSFVYLYVCMIIKCLVCLC